MCEVFFFSLGFKLRLRLESEEEKGKGGQGKGRLWGRRLEIYQSGERDGRAARRVFAEMGGAEMFSVSYSLCAWVLHHA